VEDHFRIVKIVLAAVIWSFAPNVVAKQKSMHQPNTQPAANAVISEKSELTINGQLDFSRSFLPTKISGQIEFRIGSSNKEAFFKAACFYLPYEDVNYGSDRENTRKYVPKDKLVKKRVFYGGSTAVNNLGSGKLEYLSKDIILIQGASSHRIKLSYSSHLPRQANASSTDFFYRGFYPQPLESCPKRTGLSSNMPQTASAATNRKQGWEPSQEPSQEPSDMQRISRLSNLRISAHISMNLAGMAGKWQFASSGIQSLCRCRIKTVNELKREFSFAVSNHYEIKTINTSRGNLLFFYQSADFESLFETIKKSFENLLDWMGESPYKEIVFIETAEVHALGIPGVVPFNRSRQSSFQAIQGNLLNWQKWVLSNQLSAQWYLGSTFSHREGDKWFFEGMNNFFVYQSLIGNGNSFDLFNQDHFVGSLLSLNYHQVQDLTASILRKHDPFSVLTNSKYETKNKLGDQNPLLFIRHTIALRQIVSFLGREKSKEFFRNYFQFVKDRPTSPAEFIQFIRRSKALEISTGDRAAANFSQWWTGNSWPDFAIDSIESIESENKSWATKVVIRQKENMNIPIKVRLEDDNGNLYWKNADFAESQSNKQEIEFLSSSEMSKIEIDPNRKVFDSNRFNGNSSFPGLKFFPGSTNTISDEDYTVFWMPDGYRRPGEPIFLGVTGVIFRYINSGLYFSASNSISSDVQSFVVRHKNNFASFAVDVNTSINQDFRGNRIVLLAIERSPVFKEGPPLTGVFKARRRRVLGRPQTIHHTFSLGLGISPRSNIGSCGYKIGAESEFAPRFSYQRDTLKFAGQCYFGGNFSFGMRLFHGKLGKTKGEVPTENYFIINNLEEAHLRIDDSDIEAAKEIRTASFLLGSPLSLPIPGETLILSRNIRFQIFYDIGRSFDLDRIRNFRAGGVRLGLPFGGDLMGAGALSVASFSLSAILYSNNDGLINKEPSYFFNFSGGL